MKYIKFDIKNYKGIKNESIDLNVLSSLRIYTLVGLNESGKTSVLEAISFFQTGTVNRDSIIPKDKKLNFNDIVSVSADIELDLNDEKAITKYLLDRNFVLTEQIKKISVTKKVEYKSSKPTHNNIKSTWLINLNGFARKSKNKTTKRLYDSNNDLWNDVVAYIETKLFPKIILYSNFLFQIPPRIYLASKNKAEGTVPTYLLKSNDQYYLLLQDILDSLGQNLKIEEHLIKRFLSDSEEDKDNITHVLNAMSGKVTEEVFQTWGKISGISIAGKEVVFGDSIKEDDEGYYLELKVKEGTKTYLVEERSLGFRWFFAFLLFTQFRKFRENDPPNTLFLLDEPASNLHQSGQQELLTLLESITDRSIVVYSTHSHHLISPKWLGGAYIIKNEAIDPDAKSLSNILSISATDIKIFRYFHFAAQYPKQQSHYKPILEVLDYKPSQLEMVPSVIIVEGKFDFYNFNYMQYCLNSSKLNFYPGNGASGQNEIISLYLSWGVDFFVLLDDDDEGKNAKLRYVKEFGPIIETKIGTFNDISQELSGKVAESLTEKEDKENIIREVFEKSKKSNKELFNLAIQSMYMNNTKYNFSSSTKNNFSIIFKFLTKQLKEK